MNDALLVANVTEVRGTSIKARMLADKNELYLFHDGTLVRNVSVGGYVKIPCGFDSIIGIVDGEYQKEHSNLTENSDARSNSLIEYDRFIEISVFGVLKSNMFERGISALPLVSSNVYLLTLNELEKVNANGGRSNIGGGRGGIEIGRLAEDPEVSVYVNENEFFASHIGIFGNTGSGKSNTLCKLFTDEFSRIDSKGGLRRSKSRFLFIDFNGEYASDEVLTSAKHVTKLSTRNNKGDRLSVPEDFYYDSSIWAMLTQATDKTQKPFLNSVLRLAKRIKNANDKKAYLYKIVDSLIAEFSDKPRIFIEQRDDVAKTFAFLLNPYDLDSAEEDIRDTLSSIESFNWGHDNKPPVLKDGDLFCHTPEKARELFSELLALTSNIENLSNDVCKFLEFVARLLFLQRWLNGGIVKDHIAWWLPRYSAQLKESSKLYKVEDSEGNSYRSSEEPVQVISLLNVNQDQKKLIPLVLAKYAYAEQRDGEKYTSTHLIIDEAHNILSYSSQRESESWRDYRLETFEEIIKEGRKFGMYLTVCSQRPSDISPTIISQLHNYLIHRLVNDEDLRAIEKAVAFIDRANFSMVPVLPQGGCIASGTALSYPTRIQVDALPREKRPLSSDRDLVSAWFNAT